MKKTLYLFLFLVTTANFSCDPCSSSAYADLITKTLEMASKEQITAGDAVDYIIAIQNLQDVLVECTETANENNYDFDVYYSETEPKSANDMKKIGNASYSCRALMSDEVFNDKNPVTYQRKGYYSLKGISDSKFQVNERDESNNTKSAEDQKSKKSSIDKFYFFVEGSEKIEKRLKSGEVLDYVVFGKKANLVSSTSLKFNN